MNTKYTFILEQTAEKVQAILNAIQTRMDEHGDITGLLTKEEKRLIDAIPSTYATKEELAEFLAEKASKEELDAIISAVMAIDTKVENKEDKSAHSKDMEVVGFRLDVADDRIDSNTSLINSLARILGEKVPVSRKVNGKSLADDVTLYGSDIRISVENPRSISQGMAALNSQGALTTGQEQRLVVDFINVDNPEMPVKPTAPGVYFNGKTSKIETYASQGSGILALVKIVLSETPSQNVVYCDKIENKLYRWDGTSMVLLTSGGGGGGDYVPLTRTINGKSLSADITLNGKDIPYGTGSNTVYQEIKDFKDSVADTFEDIEGILEGKVETTTTINGQPLKADITLDGNNINATLGEATTTINNVIEFIGMGINMKQDALVSGDNIKTINGESILGSGGITIEGGTEEIYIGTGTPPADAKIAINPDESFVSIEQTTGDSTTSVMSQKAVTDAINNIPMPSGGDWELIADITLTENVGNITQTFEGVKEVFVLITGIIFTNGSSPIADDMRINVNRDTVNTSYAILGSRTTTGSRSHILHLYVVGNKVYCESVTNVYNTATLNMTLGYNNSIPSVESINKIIMFPTTTSNLWNAGTTIKIYAK